MQLHGRFGRRVAGIGVLLILGAVAVAPGTMASSATIVSGLQVPDTTGACNDNPDAIASYQMSGSLIGCWYTDTGVYKNVSPTGFLATGTEHFVGCLGSSCGTLFTTFTFTATYVGDVEAHGRCHHPITGGTGAFAGATGSINFKDDPSGCATYHGEVKLAGS